MNTDLTTSLLFQVNPALFADPKFNVVDTKTGDVVAKNLPKQRARTVRDNLDAKYGAVRFAVKVAQ